MAAITEEKQMRYTLGHTPITAPRGLSARTRTGIAGLAILGASVAGLALPGTAMCLMLRGASPPPAPSAS